jgi:hypothetical protein
MLTLEETLSSQNDLETLCLDRALETNELFTPNDFYGNSLILKAYAGLPFEYALKVIVPHGASPADSLWEAERNAPLPAILGYWPELQQLYARETDKVVIPSALSFLYLLELLKAQPQPERRGTIFFPSHSTHHIAVQMDFEALAEELTRLGDEYQPVTVCIYWRDFNLGHHLPFQERGLRIVSAGHIFDPLFLFRFYHLCSMHRYAASNGLGSQLFYSIKAGCSYFHLDTGEYSFAAEDYILKRDTATIPPAREATLKSLFSDPRPTMTAEQIAVVDYYLGTDHFKSPRELRRQFLYAEILDKVGFVVRNEGKAAHFIIPTYYRRCGQVCKRGLLGAGRRLSRLWKRGVAGLPSR